LSQKSRYKSYYNSTVYTQAEVSKKNPDTGYLLILSNTGWTATILDSGLDSVSQKGSKNSVVEFECALGTGTYSLSVQKDTEAGLLFLTLIQNGNIKDDASTKVAYGIASLSGNCGEAEGKFK
jgi:hypothetical protein